MPTTPTQPGPGMVVVGEEDAAGEEDGGGEEDAAGDNGTPGSSQVRKGGSQYVVAREGLKSSRSKKGGDVIPNGGRGNRWMYRMTGLPGWMRFGYSPGWMGQSPTGLGPGASYLMTGQWPTPQAQAYWQAMQAGQAPYPAYGVTSPYGGPQMSPGEELDFLKHQAQMVRDQLSGIEDRIKELEEKE